MVRLSPTGRQRIEFAPEFEAWVGGVDLPEGHPGRVQLLDCDQAATGPLPAMAVPRVLLDWLSDHSGSIYVAR